MRVFTPRPFRKGINAERANFRLSVAEDKARRISWANALRSRVELDKIIWLGPFTDLKTKRKFKTTPAPCGSGCYCAAEYKYVK